MEGGGRSPRLKGLAQGRCSCGTLLGGPRLPVARGGGGGGGGVGGGYGRGRLAGPPPLHVRSGPPFSSARGLWAIGRARASASARAPAVLQAQPSAPGEAPTSEVRADRRSASRVDCGSAVVRTWTWTWTRRSRRVAPRDHDRPLCPRLVPVPAHGATWCVLVRALFYTRRWRRCWCACARAHIYPHQRRRHRGLKPVRRCGKRSVWRARASVCVCMCDVYVGFQSPSPPLSDVWNSQKIEPTQCGATAGRS